MVRFVLGLVVLAATAATASADFHCSSCNSIINTSWWTGPCPICGRNTVHRHHPGHHHPQPHNQSDLFIGIRIAQRSGGVIVDSVIPNTLAHGKFFQNDRLLRYAYKDAATGRVIRRSINWTHDVTTMKNNAGAGNPIAILVTRPVIGSRKFLITLGGTITTAVPYTETRADGSQVQRTRQETRAVESSVTEGGNLADELLGDSDNGGDGGQIIDGGQGGGGGLLDQL